MSELRDAMLNHYSHNNNNNNDDNELARYVLAHYWYSVQLICSTVRKSSDAQRRERARAKYPPQVFALIEIAAPRRICATVRKSSDAQRRERARAKYPPPAAGEGTPPERPACGRRGHAARKTRRHALTAARCSCVVAGCFTDRCKAPTSQSIIPQTSDRKHIPQRHH
jgi:hypothetical protein